MPVQRRSGWPEPGAGAVALCLVVSSALALVSGSDAAASEIRFATGDGLYRMGITSYRDLPFQTVVRQNYDFSCGAAAVATLLTYHLDRPTNEREVMDEILRLGDEAEIRARGFSLLEMKLYLESRGFLADGYPFSLDELNELGIPAIVLIDTDGYKHFVVIKGIDNGRVLVGDPAFGLKTYERSDFEDQWNGIVFIVHSVDEVWHARGFYNREEEWALRPEFASRNALTSADLAASRSAFRYPVQLRGVRN